MSNKMKLSRKVFVMTDRELDRCRPESDWEK